MTSGSGSGVERLLAKEKVEGSNPFSRSKFYTMGMVIQVEWLGVITILVLAALAVGNSSEKTKELRARLRYWSWDR